MTTGSAATAETQRATRPAKIRTIIALFDDTIDTELALGDLRKAHLPPEQISAILREQVIDMERSISNQTMLSRVIAVSALDAVSGWLKGLLTLVLSDRAAYLVAGPIGVSLANGSDEIRKPIWQDWTREDAHGGVGLTSGQLARALTEFGIGTDEAVYVEQRVVAGSTLIAVTSADVLALRTALAIFSKRTAVHVGVAQTKYAISAIATELLETGPQAGNGSVVVADALSPLRHLRKQPKSTVSAFNLVGKPLLTRAGDVLGIVIDALLELREGADPATGATAFIVRYLIVRQPSFLNLRYRRTAVPRDVVEDTGEAFVLRRDHVSIQRAPRYTPRVPLSRQQEMRIRQYFDASFYWQSTPASDEHQANHS